MCVGPLAAISPIGALASMVMGKKKKSDQRYGGGNNNDGTMSLNRAGAPTFGPSPTGGY